MEFYIRWYVSEHTQKISSEIQILPQHNIIKCSNVNDAVHYIFYIEFA